MKVDIRALRKENQARAALYELGWYHSFRFADGSEFRGILSLELAEYRYSKFPIPDDLRGKQVLDIGAWDGWFSFEAERRGAQVTAVDDVEKPTFWRVHEKLHSKVTYRELDLFEIPGADLGTFDYVFFLGVLYHTKYPVLALEIVCGLTRDLAIVESYITDAEDWQKHRNDIPFLEFYETDELGGQLDNWFGPTVGCLQAMCRTAGFARVEILHVENNRAALACYRSWDDLPVAEDAPVIIPESVKNARRQGINFRSNREEYLSCWFRCDRDRITCDDIRVRVGKFGISPMYLAKNKDGQWLLNFRLPPNLSAAWYPVQISMFGSNWVNFRSIAVDLEAEAQLIQMDTVCDSATWARGQVDVARKPAFVSFWVTGLGDNCDEVNTQVFLDGSRLKVTFVGEPDGEGKRQVNSELPEAIPEGTYRLITRFGGVESEPQSITLVSGT